MYIVQPSRSLGTQLLIDKWLLYLYQIAGAAAILGVVAFMVRRLYLDGYEWKTEWIWCIGVAVAGYLYGVSLQIPLYSRGVLYPNRRRMYLLLFQLVLLGISGCGIFYEAGILRGLAVMGICLAVLPVLATLFVAVHVATR